MNKPAPRDDDYRPLTRRRRLLIAGLAVVTAVVVMWLMLRPQLRLIDAEQARKAAGPTPCTGQQTQGCVGGTMAVISAPARAASTRP